MILLSVAQTAYIASASIGILFIAALVAFLFYKNRYAQKHIRELTYLKLYRLSQSNDYLLLNNYKVNIDDKHIGVIDHILICKKYIVLVNDFAISGVLSGDFVSEQLKNTKKEGTEIVVNPLNYNINLAKRLSLFTGLEQSFIKGLVVVNNDSFINVTNMNRQFKIIKRRELARTIKEFDEDNVKNLKEESVVKFIKHLDEHNK